MLVRRGYGQTIALVVTRGYAIGEAVVDERNRGGWLSPDQVKALRRIVRETEKARDTDSKRKKKDRERRLSELATIYDSALGVVTEETLGPVREILRPYSAVEPDRVPRAPEVDFVALSRNLDDVRRLAEAFIDANRTEEEVLMLLMLAA